MIEVGRDQSPPTSLIFHPTLHYTLHQAFFEHLYQNSGPKKLRFSAKTSSAETRVFFHQNSVLGNFFNCSVHDIFQKLSSDLKNSSQNSKNSGIRKQVYFVCKKCTKKPGYSLTAIKIINSSVSMMNSSGSGGMCNFPSSDPAQNFFSNF